MKLATRFARRCEPNGNRSGLPGDMEAIGYERPVLRNI